MECPFQGSYVALPTPFSDDQVDDDTLDRLVDFHVEHGSDGLVVAGTSGEAATLTDYERRSVIERVITHSAGRLPVIAGTGTNATRASVDFTRFAAEAGADGVLAVTPYYNKPSPAGLMLHFGEMADATELPVVLYNVPSRTGLDMQPDTVTQLRGAHPNIVAIKEASGSLHRAQELMRRSDIAVLAGEDGLIADMMGVGAAGVIGVVANVAPAEVAELCEVATPGGDPARAAELTAWLAPLIESLFLESNPVPMKAALAAMELCPAEVRLPLAPLADGTHERLLGALSEAGLLPAGTAAR